MNPELLRVEDFCSRYGISRATLYRLVNKGELTLFKTGRATRVKTAEAEAWFNSLQRSRAA